MPIYGLTLSHKGSIPRPIKPLNRTWDGLACEERGSTNKIFGLSYKPCVSEALNTYNGQNGSQYLAWK